MTAATYSLQHSLYSCCNRATGVGSLLSQSTLGRKFVLGEHVFGSDIDLKSPGIHAKKDIITERFHCNNHYCALCYKVFTNSF